MVGEIWKPCVGCPELEVSSNGKIRSIDRSVMKTSPKGLVFTQNIKGKELAPSINRSGYYEIRTQINGVKLSKKLHIEVALAFLGECPESYVVDHIDQNKLNNSIENLRYVSYSENNKNSSRNRLGKLSPNFTGSVVAICKDTGNILAEMSGNKEMEANGFDYRLVSAVLLGKRKSHRGCVFEKINNKTQPIISLYKDERWSRSAWRDVEVLSIEGEFITTLTSMQAVIDFGMTEIHVLSCLKGKLATHKGYQLRLL